MTEITTTRAALAATVRDVLDERAQECREEHGAIGLAVADRLARLALVIDRDDKPENIGSRETLPAPPEGLDLGLWIDDAPRLVLSPAYLDRLHALPLSHIAVMVERSGGGLDLTWTLTQLRELASATPALERVLTLWPEPTVAYMGRLRAVLPGLLRALGSTTVEFDLEGHWKSAHIVGYGSLRAAGAALTAVVDEVAPGVEVEVTTFPLHGEARASGSVRGEDRLLLQTYSVAAARGEVREFTGRYGPERRPYEDVLRAMREGEAGVEVCAGLAAWEQADWPGTPEVSMQLALDSAVRAGVTRVRWWSSKHVIGARANSYAARAIEAARELSVVGRA